MIMSKEAALFGSVISSILFHGVCFSGFSLSGLPSAFAAQSSDCDLMVQQCASAPCLSGGGMISGGGSATSISSTSEMIGLYVCKCSNGQEIGESYCSVSYPAGISPTFVGTPTDQPANACGSIVGTDNQKIGEQVRVVGTPFFLTYSSDRVIGRTADYSLSIPLTGSDVTGIATGTITLTYLGRTATVTVNPIVSNYSYNFVWDGNDSSGNPVSGGAIINLNEGFTYTSSGITDWPIIFNLAVGSYRATIAGLGGWTLSPHHYYSSTLNRLYLGDGSTRTVTASAISGSTNVMVASKDGSEVYVFDSTGKHLTTKNGRTGSVIYTFAYDTQGRLSSITDAYSNVTQIQRNGSGVLTGIQAPFGQVTTLSLDGNGYLASIENPATETYSMTYYTGGLLHTFQKPGGQTSTMVYDSNGLLTSDSSSAGNSTSFTVTDNGITSGTKVFSTSSALSRATSYSLTASNAATTPGYSNRAVTNPQSEVSTFTYTPSTSMSSSENGISVNDSYSTDARLSTAMITSNRSVSGPASFSQSRAQVLNPSTITDPFTYTSVTDKITTNGNETDVVYTLATGITQVTTPEGRKLTVLSDTFGKPKSLQLDDLDAVQYSYDTHGRLSAITQNSRQSNIVYNTSGYIDHITNALSQSTSFTYDGAGRVLTQTLPDTRVITYSYDSNGNLTSVTPPGEGAHALTPNAFDLLATYGPPLLTGVPTVNTTYAYNNDKQLTQITRPDGNQIVFNYSSTGGQLTSITVPGGSYGYTISQGNPTAASSPDGIAESRTYSGHYLTNESVTVGGTTLGSLQLGYDSYFGVSSSTVTDASSNTASVSYQYDNDHLLIVAGSETLDRCSTGQVDSIALDQITQSLGYDVNSFGLAEPRFGELSTVSATYTPTGGSSSTLFSQTFSRDALGRISTKSETISGTTHSYVYTYDSAGRLTDVTKDGSAYSHYGYDSNSNRTSGNVGGATLSAAYDAQDRLTSYNTKTYTYTANGEIATQVDSSTSPAQTTSFTYDVMGNLKNVALPSGDQVSYLTDGFNRRTVRKKNGTITQQYLYEDQLRLAATLDASGNLNERFIWGSKPNVPDYILKAGTRYQVISDPNGSVRLVVKSTDGTIAQRIDYDEFGNVLSDTSPGFQPFGFAGGLYDSDTKIVRFGARDYDVSTGRWLSKDPLLFGGGQTNLYGYVLNDPVNLTDPSGKIVPYLAYIGYAALAGATAQGIASAIVAPEGQRLSAFFSGAASGFVTGAVAGVFAPLGGIAATAAGLATDFGLNTQTVVQAIPGAVEGQSSFINHPGNLQGQIDGATSCK